MNGKTSADWLTAESAFVRDLLCSRQHSDLVERADVGREAAMNAEYLGCDDSGDGKTIENINK